MQASDGSISWTTKRGARRLVDQKLAFELADGSLMMGMLVQTEPEPAPLNVIVMPWRKCWSTSEAAVLRFEGRRAA